METPDSGGAYEIARHDVRQSVPYKSRERIQEFQQLCTGQQQIAGTYTGILRAYTQLYYGRF